MTRKYSHIIFDIDGTLIDTEKTSMLSLQQTVKERLGEDRPYEELLKVFGYTSEEAVKIVGFKNPESDLLRWEELYLAKRYLAKPYPGVDNLLNHLQKEGYRMGLVTSRNKLELQSDKILEGWSDLGYFNSIIGSSDTERAKPFPDPLLEYMRRHNAEPQECIFIGDTIFDAKCAKAAGITFALIEWRKPADPSLNQEAKDLADFIIHNTDDILSII